MTEEFTIKEDTPTRRRKGRLALWIALGLLLVLGLSGIGLVAAFQSRLDANIERFPDPFEGLTDRPSKLIPNHGNDDGDQAEPVNFLLLGTDSRISAGDPSQWQAGAQRTDAMMLVQLSGDREAVTVMSIPRDSWVSIPGHRDNKINAAFAFGGPSLAVHTVEQLTGVRIDHVAIADFDSFASLTDELEGVDITLTQPLTAGGTTLQPGAHRLNGEQALRYARERKNVAGGDFGRVQRQQNWMRSIMLRTFERDVLTNPARLMGFLETVSKSVAVDENLTIGDMRGLAISARNLRPGGVRFITAPYTGTGWSPDGRQSIVNLDHAALAEISAAFADGTIAEFLEENPDIAPRLGSEVDVS